MQFTLQAGESAALAPAGTVRVCCHAGFLWITGFRNGDDVVLGAGDCAVLPPAERHYFSALGKVPHAAFDLRCEGGATTGRADWQRAGRALLARMPAVAQTWRLRWRETVQRLSNRW